MNRLFCFGYGYISDFLGRTLVGNADLYGSWSLSGTTRDLQKRAALRQDGIDAYLFDSDKPLGDPLQMLDGVTHILISTPPDHNGDLVEQFHADDILRLKSLKWVGYLSTAAVYGDRDGLWVDETSELRPSSIRGSRRLRAERDWMQHCNQQGLPLQIFRLAGIYGPGKSALDSVRAGIKRRILKAGHAFSRVHVDDVIQTLILSFTKGQAGDIFNVVDDEAAPSHEVIAYACRLLGKEPPPIVPFEDANLAPITASFYADNKSIRNGKIKNQLGVNLKYPNYREGLEGCLAEEQKVAQSRRPAPWIHQISDDPNETSD
jgi:hypothetical protein